MATRHRPVWDWVTQLKNVFTRRQPRGRRLNLEMLEDRCCPAVFNPSAIVADGDAGSLRDAIIQANGNADNVNTFNLQGVIYELTVGNDGGQENAAEGDLDLTGFNKTYIFQGQGRASTFIDANQIDRVFQVLPGATVIFRDLTITGGLATDDGDDLAAGSTTAKGGGILISGSTLTLRNVDVVNNTAQGSSGSSGSTGQDGGEGLGAQGGGIYAENSTLDLKGTTEIRENDALGGAGGAGGDFLDFAPANLVGTGGAGGAAQGGGIYILGGQLTMIGLATVVENTAVGGQGGEGGTGSDNSPGGGAGGAGGVGQGGGLYAESAAVVIGSRPFSDNLAQGGQGGAGGDDGDPFGGIGGEGGAGQGGGIFAINGTFAFARTQVSENQAVGGQGGEGGLGGESDPGGAGGTGGVGQGGGLFLNVAAPTISLAVISTNQATGGVGGRGGDGGTEGDENLNGGAGGTGGTGQGGGVFVVTSDFTMNLKKSTVSGNTAQGGEGGRGGDGGTNNSNNDDLTGGVGGTGGNGQGGGLFLSEGTARIRRSTFSTNQALGGDGGLGGNGGRGDDPDNGNTGLAGGNGGTGGDGQGGGLYNQFPGTLTLINSTVSSNIARGGNGGEGGFGGIATDTSLGTITDFTTGVAGIAGTGGNGQGGGLYNDGGTLNIFNSTIAFNQARQSTDDDGGTGDGGGIFGDGEEFLISTIVGDNTADDTGPDFFGDVEAKRSLIENITDTDIIDAGGNITGVDALLGALADNGGPTFTHKLLGGSPAINKGLNPLNLFVDQRGLGFPRVKGTRIDIGAVEK